MVKTFKILIACVLLVSCADYIPKRVSKNFFYCYDSHTDYSKNSVVKFNGIYKICYCDSISIKCNENCSFEYMRFFPNGICATSSRITHNLNFEKELIVDNDTLCAFTLRNSAYTVSKNVNEFYGLYKISGDTIKMMTVNDQVWPNPYWYHSEYWYIISGDTLKTILDKSYTHDNPTNKVEPMATIHFIEKNISVTPDVWLKRKKWFWCNSQEYEKYMKKRK